MKPAKSPSSRRSALHILYVVVTVFCLVAGYRLMGFGGKSTPVQTQADVQSDIRVTSLKTALQPMNESAQVIEPEPDLKKQVSGQSKFEGPLLELVPTETQMRLLYEAEEALVATCMNERGFEYKTNPYLSNDELEPESEPEPIEPGDTTTAQNRGYGVADSIARDKDKKPLPASPNNALLANLSPEQQQAWREAFSGRQLDPDNMSIDGSLVDVEVPSVGMVIWDNQSCLATARRAIYSDDVKQMQDEIEENALRRKIADVVEQDSEYQGVLKQWRDCMSGRGFPYEYPQQAAGTLHQEYAKGALDRFTLQEREIEIATADATCYQRHSVGEAHAAAERRAEASVRAESSEKIEALYNALQNALTQAKQYAPSGSDATSFNW